MYIVASKRLLLNQIYDHEKGNSIYIQKTIPGEMCISRYQEKSFPWVGDNKENIHNLKLSPSEPTPKYK
jgi:hypothetical protein